MRKTIAQTLLIAGLVAGSVSIAQAADATQAVEQYVDDATITTKIKGKYAADEAVSALEIGVETKDGVVQLSGFGKSAAEKVRAEELARQVDGVVEVKNDIVITP